MKENKSSLLLILTITLLLTLQGCGKTAINNEADEIKLYSWVYSGEQGISSTLEFHDDEASLNIVNDSEKCLIKGLCVFSENKLVIIDTKLQKEFAFEFELYGREIILKYGDKTINLQKVDNFHLD